MHIVEHCDLLRIVFVGISSYCVSALIFDCMRLILKCLCNLSVLLCLVNSASTWWLAAPPSVLWKSNLMAEVPGRVVLTAPTLGKSEFVLPPSSLQPTTHKTQSSAPWQDLPKEPSMLPAGTKKLLSKGAMPLVAINKQNLPEKRGKLQLIPFCVCVFRILF